MKVIHGLIVALAGSVVAGSCGGKAVVDEAGGPSSSGTGASGTGGNGTTSSTSSTSSSGGDLLCAAACEAIAECLDIEVSSCVASCSAANPSCKSPFDEWLNCVIDLVPPSSCDLPLECLGVLGQWHACEDPGFEEVGCSADLHSCECVVNQDGPMLQAACDTDYFLCSCIAGDDIIGTCIDLTEETLCNPLLGCCATLFFVTAQ